MAVPELIHVSYSQLQTWRTCRRKWYFNYVEQLQPAAAKPPMPLLLGSAVHEALDAYYDPASGRKASLLINTFKEEIDNYRKQVWLDYEITEQVEKDFDYNENLGYAMLENYATEAPGLDDFIVIHTEHLFSVPIGVSIDYLDRDTGLVHKVPLYYKGRIDGIIETASGSIYLLEHKTAKQFATNRLILDQQATSYMWAAQEDFGLPVRGVLYNILRKQMPGPRVKAPLIQRFDVTRSQAHIEGFPLTVQQIARDMELASADGLYYHNPADHCAWCQYLPVCSMMQDAVDPTDYLNQFFEEKGNDVSRSLDLESLVV